MEYKNPGLVADGIIYNGNMVLLIKRKSSVYNNYHALPGGFIDYSSESIEQTVVRELKEETSLDVIPIDILGVYSKPDRDPRDHVVSIVFICDFNGQPSAGDDASDIKWVDLNDIEAFDLAFDHDKIIADFIKWRKNKGTFWSSK